MSKKTIQKIFLGVGLLLSVIGVKSAKKLSDSNFEVALVIGMISVIVGFFCLLAGIASVASKAHIVSEHNVNTGASPVYITDFNHISGLGAFPAEGEMRIYIDKIDFSVGGTHYELPMERIINIGISTTSHTEYDLKAHPMRGVIGGLLLGEFGLLWGAEHELVKAETKEYFLVIAYRKDEATKFITLGNVDCKKIISTVSKYVDFQEQNVQL